MSVLDVVAVNCEASCWPIVELRQYTLHAGRRDTLVALFDAEFVAPQEALGAHVVGQFRDLDDVDRFVWLRGFASMEARADALAAFYDGPVWKAHRSAANETMLDSDNVLLLRPWRAGAGFAPVDARPPRSPASIVTATIHELDPTTIERFASFFETTMRPMLERLGVEILAVFVSHPGPNSFPRLPIRADAPVLIWFARFAGEADQRAFADRWSAESGWRDAAPEALLPAFMRKPEVLRLRATAGSALR